MDQLFGEVPQAGVLNPVSSLADDFDKLLYLDAGDGALVHGTVGDSPNKFFEVECGESSFEQRIVRFEELSPQEI